MFPYPTSYRDEEGNDVTFQYLSRLVDFDHTKAVFKASTSDGRVVVVKFASRYNPTAHQLLASKGFAPPLLYNGMSGERFGGLFMVVMGFAPGEMVGEEGLPDDIHRSVTDAVSILHEANWVFGDLRRPNVLVDGHWVHLVDFDWCGEDGKGRYPPTLNDNDDMDWHADVQRNGLMRKEHDLHLLARLRHS